MPYYDGDLRRDPNLENYPCTKIRVLVKGVMWDFPKIGGTLSWGPYNKDPTI